MLDFLAWGLRVATLVLAFGGGIALYAAAPADGRGPVDEAEARCSYVRSMVDLARIAPATPAGIAALQEEALRCPPPRRTTWDADQRDLGLKLLGIALAALILSAMLASAAKRERLAEDLVAATRRGAPQPPAEG